VIPPLLRERILARAAVARVILEPEHVERLAMYYQLLDRWNRTINLTSLPLATYPDGTLDRLIVEPLILATEVDDSPLTWVDFGTGGGSPAIPLKIVRPAAGLTMVEARERKAAFLREVVSSVGLAGANVLTSRIEDLGGPKMDESVDFITLRALKIERQILDCAVSLLRPRGLLFVFRGDMPLVFNEFPLKVVSHRALAPSRGFVSAFEKTS
jgi:16S rRNA (guanine527-N7)-methyltransferase